MAAPSLDDATPGPAASGAGPIAYRIGTLSYTRLGLLDVFFWMLWGDLCVNIMETIVPRMVPLHLERLGAGSATIGLVAASVPAAVELIVNPFVSTYSDRFRSRLGRRRPFLLTCTPILTICLMMVGFADKFAPAVHRVTAAVGMSEASSGIVLIAALLTVFQVFNVVVLATYYYLIADVVPSAVIGRFTSMYKVVGALGGVVFNQFLFKYADHYEWQIYAGCAGVYFAAFMLMAWRVKEGEYPPPPAPPAGADGSTAGAVAGAVRWMQESFAIRFYQKLYLIGLCYWSTFYISIYTQFFALNDLHLSKPVFGHISAVAGLLALPVFFVMGPLADRFHPLRMVIVGMAVSGASSLASYFLIRDARSFEFWTIANAVTQTVYLGGQISLMPRLLPLDQYGQYCAANNTLCAIGKFGGPALAGLLIGWLGANRVSYLWNAGFGFAGTAAGLVAYAHFKRLGGDAGYTPPRWVQPRSIAFEVAPIAGPAGIASNVVTAVGDDVQGPTGPR